MTLNPSKLDVAILWAVTRHAGQVDKAGLSYILHPLRVMERVRYHLMTDEIALKVLGVSLEDIMIATVLHDTLEDTDLPYEDILNHFGERVAGIVLCLTRKRSCRCPGSPVAGGHMVHKVACSYLIADETYQGMIERISKDPAATVIKLADLEDNLNRISSLPEAERSIEKQYKKAKAYLLRVNLRKFERDRMKFLERELAHYKDSEYRAVGDLFIVVQSFRPHEYRSGEVSAEAIVKAINRLRRRAERKS